MSMERRDYIAAKSDDRLLRCFDPEDEDADMLRRIESSTPVLCYRLYFAVLSSGEIPRPRKSRTHFFCIDDKLVYQNFCNDFGPLNIAMVYEYCMMLHEMLQDESLDGCRIVHCTKPEAPKILNSAFLIGSYAIIYLNYTTKSVLQTLKPTLTKVLNVHFCDASQRDPYFLTLSECLAAMAKAHRRVFFSFRDFDVQHYQHYERVENGDMNWIVPGKFLAFCGPQTEARLDNTSSVHGPDAYIGYFKKYNIGTVIRLNLKRYHAKSFTDHGIKHYDLFFVDGGTPSDYILRRFLEICEAESGAIAVHCRAGLGRTGTVIGAYLMKHYGFTALEAIAWLRICRPGSVIGQQQIWLQSKQHWLTAEGTLFRRHNPRFTPKCHSYGIYSLANEQHLDNSMRSADSEERVMCREATKKSNIVVNNNSPNTERPNTIGNNRPRAKSILVDNRVAPNTANQQGVGQKARDRNMIGSPSRDDKLAAGTSRQRKSSGVALEQTFENIRKSQGDNANKAYPSGKNIDKIENQQKRISTILEPSLENVHADDASHPPTNLALHIPLQSTKPKENVIATETTQPSPPPLSDLLQAEKRSPSLETIPGEHHPPMTLTSQSSAHTTVVEVKIDAANETQQSCEVSSASPITLKRSSSLEALPWNENDERSGHAGTHYESFGEDSIDDTVDILIPVVDVHYLSKIQTERPRRMKKLAALSCITKRLRSKSTHSPSTLGQQQTNSTSRTREKEVAAVRVPRRRQSTTVVVEQRRNGIGLRMMPNSVAVFDDRNILSTAVTQSAPPRSVEEESCTAKRLRSKSTSSRSTIGQQQTNSTIRSRDKDVAAVRVPRRRQSTAVVVEQRRNGIGLRMMSNTIAVFDERSNILTTGVTQSAPPRSAEEESYIAKRLLSKSKSSQPTLAAQQTDSPIAREKELATVRGSCRRQSTAIVVEQSCIVKRLRSKSTSSPATPGHQPSNYTMRTREKEVANERMPPRRESAAIVVEENQDDRTTVTATPCERLATLIETNQESAIVKSHPENELTQEQKETATEIYACPVNSYTYIIDNTRNDCVKSGYTTFTEPRKALRVDSENDENVQSNDVVSTVAEGVNASPTTERTSRAGQPIRQSMLIQKQKFEPAPQGSHGKSRNPV